MGVNAEWTRKAADDRVDSPRSVEQLIDIRQQQLSHVLYWRFYVNLALMLVDAAMFIIAGATVLLVLGQPNSFMSYQFGFRVNVTVYMCIAAALYVLCLQKSGIYHRHVMGDGYQINTLLFKGAVECWVLLCALNFALNLDLWLSTLTYMLAAAWLLTVLSRAVSRVFITRGRRKGEYAYGTVVVGSPEGIGRTLKFLARRQQLNYRPVAVCPIRFNKAEGRIERETNLDTLNDEMAANWGSALPVLEYDDYHLAERMVDMHAQTVMISDVFKRYSDNYNIFSVRMESLGLEVAMVASVADTSGHEITIRSIQGTTIITQRLAQYSPANRIVKRVFDLVVSSLAIVCSLIVTVPVAIAIKLTDGGPVFYTQTRIGLRGKPFQMIKFRSMVTNADELKAKLAEETGQEDRFIFKMKDDPRITKVGKFIRRFSIDELPQFLNVFKGDMSVVGPRPPLPEEYARYNRLYATRMLVKPGITGPWQVSGRSDLSAEESESLDVSYVQNWSVLGDIVLMLRTVGAVLGHKGAY
ncbi:galactosyl transferase [Bifidobacterium lemurum]|uniref:Galactosyl transferase n=1 Tax=Bifidobacterium lemurum TaxID=1603886 RepID=A0A261FQC7_9BIFI|nr:sugar transferase [Bifidobacterium lemurum]OZG61339.1 galactosyl transferase [Bifidobacterium lemurum]QOL34725.1 sugar transferase [Bifidobacterium lemurum]